MKNVFAIIKRSGLRLAFETPEYYDCFLETQENNYFVFEEMDDMWLMVPVYFAEEDNAMTLVSPQKNMIIYHDGEVVWPENFDINECKICGMKKVLYDPGLPNSKKEMVCPNPKC